MKKTEFTIEEYKKKMRSIQIRGGIFRFVCNCLMLCIVACSVLVLVDAYVERKNISHTPVKTSMLTEETAVIPSKQYDTKIQSDGSYTKNGIRYMKIAIGNYSTTRSEQQLAILGDDTACDTEIYTLTIHNNDKFFLKVTIPNSITIVRYSIFGEKKFTKQEIKDYKKLAAKYFTYEKYTRMNYNDADDYSVAIKNMAQ